MQRVILIFQKKVFYTKLFHDLKANEKILLLHFMKITQSSKGSHQIGTKKFFKKYMEMFGVTERVIRNYLYSLRKFFSIGVKDRKYYITALVGTFKEKIAVLEADQYLDHVVTVICRRNKIKETSDDAVLNTIQLIKQYKKEATQQGENIINIITGSIASSVEGLKQKTLNSKFIHLLLRKTLGLEYTLTEPII